MRTYVDNVARYPGQTLNFALASPTGLADESMDSIRKIAQIWVREGLRAKVLELADKAGFKSEQRAALRRACQAQHVLH